MFAEFVEIEGTKYFAISFMDNVLLLTQDEYEMAERRYKAKLNKIRNNFVQWNRNAQKYIN